MVCYWKLAFATVACCVLTLGSAANAGEIYNNLPPATSTQSSDPVASDGPSYNSFSTGSNASLLTDVKLLLTGTLGTPSHFTVSLLSDSSSTPGSLLSTLKTFSDSTLSTTSSAVYDVSVASIRLAANTRYWIELSSTDPSAPSIVAWDYATDATGVGVSGEYYAYTPQGVLTVTANSDASGPYQMSVTTAPVPEPATLYQVLSAFGVGVIAIARRRIVRDKDI
jgi:PEP-CTERM motif